MAVKFLARGVYQPDYPAGGWTDGRLCPRGHYAAELIDHRDRVNRAYSREDSELKPISPDQGLDLLAGHLKKAASPAETAFLLDGNLLCEDIAAGIRFAQDVVTTANVAVYVPPADEELVQGAEASGATMLRPEDFAECDVVLVVGDPFATHPLTAGPMLEARNALRGNRLIVLDSIRGVTTKFATDVIVIPPGGEAAAIAALAQALGVLPKEARDVPAANVPDAEIQKVAEAVKKAKKCAAVISAPSGHGQGIAATTLLLGKIASAGLLPLTTYANAFGAVRIAHHLKAMPVAELLGALDEGHIKLLAVAGLDPLRALGEPLIGSALDQVEQLVHLTSLLTGFSRRADMILPLGLWFEVGGTLLAANGERLEIAVIQAPPQGARALRDILAQVTPALPGQAALPGLEPADLEARVTADVGALLRTIPAPLAAGEGECIVVATADASGFADGAVTSKLAWPALVDAQAKVRIHASPRSVGGSPPQTATDAGIQASDQGLVLDQNYCVRIRTHEKELALPAELTDDVPAGVAAVSLVFPETRALFHCHREAGAIRMVPARVSLDVQAGPPA